MNVTIIDISSLYYSVIYYCTKETSEIDSDNFKNYKELFDRYLDSILEETNATKYFIFGDGKTSFRKKLDNTYKSNRKGHHKFLYDLKFYAEDKYDIVIDDCYEADDLCISAYEGLRNLDGIDNLIIASPDGDLKQYPAKFYNYLYRASKAYKDLYIKNASQKELKETAFSEVSEAEAEKNLWMQVLTSGHNNKSVYLKGCGDKTAEQYLDYTNKLGIDYKHAVLNAYIHGIKSNECITRNVIGYGYVEGIENFSKSFSLTKLLIYEDCRINIKNQIKDAL